MNLNQQAFGRALTMANMYELLLGACRHLKDKRYEDEVVELHVDPTWTDDSLIPITDTWLRAEPVFEHDWDHCAVSAAKAASVDTVIRTMPDGYDTMLVSGASNVSQGERQLLTIARALVADPEIMILDEAASNVDARTEKVIQEAMSTLLKGRTSFVIAHRLSTIRDADKILYMEHGDILEAGTHDELMARDGRYAALYNAQFG